MSLSTPTLYLNTDSLQNGDTSPFFASLTSTGNAGPWSRVSGAEGPLRVYPCTIPIGAGEKVPLRTDFGDNTFHLIAKVDPADEDLALEIDFEKTVDGDYFYYEANPAVLSVPTDIWNDEPSRTILCDFEERTTGGDVLRIWRADLKLTRGVGDGGSPVIPSYLKYTPQTLTAPQQAQVWANLGTPPGTFDPASPGPIGGTTPDAGTFTVVNLPALPTGDANTALSQDGTILSVEEGRPLVASSVSGVARIVTGDTEIEAFLFQLSPTFTTTISAGISVPFTASRGGVRLGTSATDGYSMELISGAGISVGGFDLNGGLVLPGGNGFTSDGDIQAQSIASTQTVSTWGLYQLTITGNASISGINTGDQTSVSGNAGTATALQTPRAINGVNFDGSAPITVTAAAGTLTGTTLNSSVVTSSLTTVGNIGTGVWQGTAVGVVYGGTGVTSSTLGSLLYGSGTNTRASLTGNTSATMSVLTQTGDGSVSAAPVWTSTTGTGNVVRATSPTLVTPALGTPASGDLRNCTAATTSLAGVTTLATSAQAQTGTSAALAVTPAAMASRLMDPCFIPLSIAVMRTFTSGTGYTVDASKLAATSYTSTAGAGYAMCALGYPGLENSLQPGVDRLIVNFSKKIEISGVCTGLTGYAGDANSTGRLMLGGKVTVASGAPNSKSIGLSVAGAGANVFLSVHNGTSLTSVDTGFAQTLSTPWSFRLISDGAGNVSLSINGATAVTSSAGPTGNSASGACFLTMVEGVAGNATKFLFSLCHGWLYMAP